MAGIARRRTAVRLPVCSLGHRVPWPMRSAAYGWTRPGARELQPRRDFDGPNRRES